MKKIVLSLFICIIFSSFVFAQFKPGHYYTKDGTKREGMLRFNYGGNVFTDKTDGDCSLVYRASKKAKKEKFTTNDICCFVIGTDSFAIIKNFRLNIMASYPQDFAKVLLSGKINLYLYYSVVSNGTYGSSTVVDLVIEKDGKTDKLTWSKFKKLLPEYLSDYPELPETDDNDQSWRQVAIDTIKKYNDHFKENSGSTP